MAETSPADTRQASLFELSLMSVVVGIVAGLGAIVLRMLISVFHNLLFLGKFSLFYDANVPTPASPFGPFIILAPVIGGVIVVFLVKTWAPEAKGHGVPEVMDAIYYKDGHIRPVVVVIKSIASALSIGSGGSIGREGPIIQIGSGMGSVMGQLFHLRRAQVFTLIAAGAGGGIAATFNTPLGGVLFAVELMLPVLNPRTLLPVVLATGTATYIGRLAFGVEPSFVVGTFAQSSVFVPLTIEILPLYLLFGVIAGVASLVFIKLLYATEDLFDAMPINVYLKSIISSVMLGVTFYLLLLTTGMYHVQGVGYATIQGILTGQITGVGFLALLFVLKLFATVITLGGGASGGIFSPALFLGATLGAAFGTLLNYAFPFLGFSPVAFALVGMATIVGGTTGASLTAIIMLFEMTGQYSITLAAIIAVAAAVGVRNFLSADDIYTTKLTRRGHVIPRSLRTHLFPIRKAHEVMEPVAGVVGEGDLRMPQTMPHASDLPHYAIVAEGRRIVGIVQVDAEDKTLIRGPMIQPVGVARESTLLETAMTHMADRGYMALVVMPDKRVARGENAVGVLTRDAVARVVMNDYRR